MIDPKTSAQSKNAILPSHIAETVDAVARIHSDHHLKRTPMEIFMDDWTARLARPVVLVTVICGVALWMVLNLLAPLAGYAIIDEPPFLWLFEALTLLGVVMGILILSTQRRADQLAELREQMTLELASVTERKVAKVIELIEELRRDSPALKNRTDHEARQMSERTSPGEVLIAIKELHEEKGARSDERRPCSGCRRASDRPAFCRARSFACATRAPVRDSAAAGVEDKLGALAVSLVAFVIMLGGAAAGVVLRRTLPTHHLNEHSKDVVRLGFALIATLSALVLGLLITSAKSAYDTQRNEVRQITAKLVLLDDQLARYGPEARPARELQRQAIGPLIDRIWGERAVKSSSGAPYRPSVEGERVYAAIEGLAPQNDVQRNLKFKALQTMTSITEARVLLFEQSDAGCRRRFSGCWSSG